MEERVVDRWQQSAPKGEADCTHDSSVASRTDAAGGFDSATHALRDTPGKLWKDEETLRERAGQGGMVENCPPTISQL